MPPAPAPVTVRELVPLLFVQDIRRSVAFYVDSLGFVLAAQWTPQGRLAWCRLQRDRAALMLQQAEDEDGPPDGRGRGVGFYFNCDNVDALHAELQSRGVPVGPPVVAHYGEKQVELRDPDGYALCFQSPAASGTP